jgi:hypothetical protein
LAGGHAALDGVGAGIYGAIFPIIVADLIRGTGRFNVEQRAIITAQGIGAALSTTLAGLVVVPAGYSAADPSLWRRKLSLWEPEAALVPTHGTHGVWSSPMTQSIF